MSAAVAVPVVATPKKAKAAPKPKVAPTHPTYAAMVKSAITTIGDKKGSSRAAILKFICQKYKVGDNVAQINSRLRAALKKGATSGSLKQVKGTGASGSFRLGEKKVVEKKKTVKKTVKKPVAKKTTTASPKKKVVKKAKAPKPAKSPKKVAKKPAAAKPKKAKSPKKAKVAKKVAAPKAPKAPKA